MTNIAIFGDSIAWGSWDPEGGGWATRLRLDFMRRADDEQSDSDGYVAVHVCAVPGHRSADVEQRMAADLRAIAPDLVVIAVGINDCPGDSSQVTPPEHVERAYGSILDQALASGARVLALSTTGVSERVRPEQARRLPSHNAHLAGLCAARSVPVVDVFGLLSDEHLCLDGLHPNTAGHRVLYERVRAALEAAQTQASTGKLTTLRSPPDSVR